ncbi:aldo/keto reductase [Paenibacillus spiritus]|uniref:Aldo/keto reductase n=1 Tax=Paenibacillus spiritus TaxID=2496557 RepID=A0A5J5G8S6_9BACL|nr:MULTISPECIES: aldo/keto reductase [Paenibacillus]KAA9004117.1 aldo/keto reductase [Paenibacillus spiritus]
MQLRPYGTTDMKVSILGFGGAEIRNSDQATADRLLHSALDAGLNIIDTAECYGNSEELIGQALSGRRSDYYLFTKCGHTAGLEGADWDPVMLRESIDRSLKRLNTDYVDVIHLHSCTEEILRRGEVIQVLQEAKQAGKTRYIGYSGDHNDSRYAVGTGVFDSLETSINIADQESVAIIAEAARKGMGVTAKRPIANAAWAFDSFNEDDYPYVYWRRLQELKYDFLGDVQEGVSVALRFALTVPGVSTAIVGTRNPDRWVQNAKLLEQGMLPEEQYRSITARWAETAGPDWVGQR